ncbi:MAG: hypothetical protein KJZ76_14605 [Burkholderiaceae bacterium]|jgi:hypothetical protein|nr:hypothetical protein [Burkholderiaceae bacterium]
MKKIRFIPAIALALATATTSVQAHDDAYLDTQQAPHGGQLRMAGAYHLELVVDKSTPQAADKTVVVYVTDHAGQKVSTEGATGNATILAAKGKASVALVPDGDNRLKGTGRYASTADMKAIVQFTAKGQSPETARFTPLLKPMEAHMDHTKH